MSSPHMFFLVDNFAYKNGKYEELELIKIRSNFQNKRLESNPWSKPWLKPWVEVLEAFTDVTKLIKTIGLVESVLWRHKI